MPEANIICAYCAKPLPTFDAKCAASNTHPADVPAVLSRPIVR